jgi:hypothetical protein
MITIITIFKQYNRRKMKVSISAYLSPVVKVLVIKAVLWLAVITT